MKKSRPSGRLLGPAIILAVAAGGCGGSSATSQQQSTKQSVTQTVRSYIAAQAGGDGQAACALLTSSGQQELISLVTKASKGALPITPSCADAVTLIRTFAGATIIDALQHSQVGNVQVNGDRATAQVVDGSAFSAQQVALQKVGGAWKIASVPGLAG